jgi:DNA modification methylase
MIIANNVQRLPLPDNSVDMIFSDPPYVKTLLHTYQWLAHEAARTLKPGRFVAVMCGEAYINQIMRYFDDAGLSYYWLYVLQLANKGFTCWRSNGHRNMPIGTPVKHVLVYSKGPAVSRTATTGTYKPNGKDKVHHPWGQDVDSHRYFIDCFSHPGDLVLDPMCGGGTTAIACRLVGRRHLLGDIDPDSLEITTCRQSAQADFANVAAVSTAAKGA